MSRNVLIRLLQQTPLLLFLAVLVILGSMSERFRDPANIVNILVQASSLAVAATGMTLVLLTAGVDLSVGSVMFITVAVTGKLLFHGASIWIAFAAGVCVGCVCGALNAITIVRLKVIPFIATLALLYVARGFGLWLTSTRAMNMPDEVTQLGASKWAGIPLPIIVMFSVAIASQWFLSFTAWGRQIYAIGCDMDAARKSGVRVSLVVGVVYVLCGILAGVSGIISLTQTGAVSPSFGQQREFAALAAAVLGGTSLFGGRGNVLPGTILGALLFQTIDNGLVILNADPYIYPIIISAIIFIAVLLDTFRNQTVTRWMRRRIRQ